MFLEEGYDNTPMSHIARELGISKAALYHHYSSKENLLFDIINYCNEAYFYPIFEQTVKISDPEERLVYFLRKFTEIMTKDATSRIAVHEARRLDPKHFKETQQVWRMTYDLFKGAISELQSSGKVKELNSSFAAFAAIGMISWALYWFDYSRIESKKELSDTFIEIFLRGIKKESE